MSPVDMGMTAGIGSSAVAAFLLVFLAEFGDKSQLVCMTLAARHRGRVVFFAALTAFALLNFLAVMFGAAVAHWVPEHWVALAVAVLFGFFGVQALRSGADEDDDEVNETLGRSLWVTVFLMIFVAEFGDKTQLAVAGLGAGAHPESVWVGATLALAATSLLGVWVGKTLLQRMPIALLHRLSGLFFILLALLALWRAYTSF